MKQADFSYDFAQGAPAKAGLVSIFSDRHYLRDDLAEDLREAGLNVGARGDLADLIDGDVGLLGDIVVLDCPQVDAALLAALARLDMVLARKATQLVVSTSMEALDAVFAVFDQSAPQILVDPDRIELVVALARVLRSVDYACVNELSKKDRIMLLRLAEQVETLARKFDALGERDENDAQLSDCKREFRGAEAIDDLQPTACAPRPSLPDPRLVRRIIRQRQARARFFDAELFADPAWDMLLDLTAAHAEHRRVSVTSLCIAAGVPPTTALRWVKQMVEMGLFERVEDSADRRRAFISLGEGAVHAMAHYFAEVGEPALIAA